MVILIVIVVVTDSDSDTDSDGSVSNCVSKALLMVLLYYIMYCSTGMPVAMQCECRL